MEDFRSRSCVDWRIREGAGVYGGGPAPPPPGAYDLRCYSMCHVPSYPPPMQTQAESKKGRSSGVVTRSSSLRNCLTLSDPEIQRKRRVAGYKMYGAEGKIKSTVRKSFKWLKNRYAIVVYGW